MNFKNIVWFIKAILILILIIVIIIVIIIIIIIYFLNNYHWILLETLKSYNLKDENKTISNIYNFELHIRKYLHNFKNWINMITITKLFCNLWILILTTNTNNSKNNNNNNNNNTNTNNSYY